MNLKQLESVIVVEHSKYKKANSIIKNGLVRKLSIEKDDNFGALDIYGVIASEGYFKAYDTNISINLRTNNLIYTERDCND